MQFALEWKLPHFVLQCFAESMLRCCCLSNLLISSSNPKKNFKMIFLLALVRRSRTCNFSCHLPVVLWCFPTMPIFEDRSGLAAVVAACVLPLCLAPRKPYILQWRHQGSHAVQKLLSAISTSFYRSFELQSCTEKYFLENVQCEVVVGSIAHDLQYKVGSTSCKSCRARLSWYKLCCTKKRWELLCASLAGRLALGSALRKPCSTK